MEPILTSYLTSRHRKRPTLYISLNKGDFQKRRNVLDLVAGWDTDVVLRRHGCTWVEARGCGSDLDNKQVAKDVLAFIHKLRPEPEEPREPAFIEQMEAPEVQEADKRREAAMDSAEAVGRSYARMTAQIGEFMQTIGEAFRDELAKSNLTNSKEGDKPREEAPDALDADHNSQAKRSASAMSVATPKPLQRIGGAFLCLHSRRPE